MAESTVASDVQETLDIHSHLAPEHSLDLVPFLDHDTKPVNLVFREIMHA